MKYCIVLNRYIAIMNLVKEIYLPKFLYKLQITIIQARITFSGVQTNESQSKKHTERFLSIGVLYFVVLFQKPNSADKLTVHAIIMNYAL